VEYAARYGKDRKCGNENAEMKNAAQSGRGGKCGSGICSTKWLWKAVTKFKIDSTTLYDAIRGIGCTVVMVRIRCDGENVKAAEQFTVAQREVE